MSRIRVEVDDDINTVYPKTVILRVEATTTDGRQHQLEIRNPRGHEENRMTDDDVSDKFLRAAEPALGVARAREALNRWWSLPEVTNLTEALDLLDLPS
jgi:2-methylcitrate dehydratase